jgi:dTDP-4-dehydrorhamnose 3,5-epimerase
MKFTPNDVNGSFLIDLEKQGDERGFFARFYCQREFAQAGLENHFAQINTSRSSKAGTLRGLHYQINSSAEVKLVRCIRGAVWDVVADLRRESPTFGRWFGAELNDENRTMMYVPKGCAHGVLTLVDNAEVIYLVSEFYAPHAERGIRWDDKFFDIAWPIPPTEISSKDRSWPDFGKE